MMKKHELTLDLAGRFVVGAEDGALPGHVEEADAGKKNTLATASSFSSRKRGRER